MSSKTQSLTKKEAKLKEEIAEKIKKLINEKDEEKPVKVKKMTKKEAAKIRRRKYRWSSEFDRVLIPGLPVALAGIELTDEQLLVYLMQLKVEEISLKLRTGNLGIPVDPDERSPSPEPVYNTQGVRLNTREIRVRQKLEEERHDLVNVLTEKNPEFRPPPDYKIPANKLTDKVFIPQERYPNINFIGLLIGPRGNTLKRLETDTNCKIIIRGKGSLKDTKSRLAPMPGEDEPLHALITAPSEVALAKGISTIKRIVKDGIDCPDANNELRQMQLRELAELNGTLLAAEIARCRNCGATDHRHWECTETQNFTNMLTCGKCGGIGHLDIDCIYEGEKLITAEEKAKMDNEYQTLMKELGFNSTNMDFPQMFGLPKAMVNDLPWANNANSFLSSGNDYRNAYNVGPPQNQLSITNHPYAGDAVQQTEFIPGSAPMPTFTVRTLLSQDSFVGSTGGQHPQMWPGYSGYPYQQQNMPMYPPQYYQTPHGGGGAPPTRPQSNTQSNNSKTNT